MKYLSKQIYQIVFTVVLCMPLMAQAALPDFTRIVDQAKDPVVNISTKSKPKPSRSHELEIPDLPEGSPFGELFEKFFDRDEFDRRRRDAQSLGSGFIVSKDGYILTNHHVIEGADEVIVRMSNRREFVAKIIGSDEASDVAIERCAAELSSIYDDGDIVGALRSMIGEKIDCRC